MTSLAKSDLHAPRSAVWNARRALLALALINLFIAATADAVSLWTDGTFAGYGHVVLNGIFFGQAMVLGTLAALVPQRGVVGLTAIIACMLLGGYALWLVTWPMQPTLLRGVPFTAIYVGLYAIATQLLLWSCRIVWGWRVAAGELLAARQSGQFQLGEMFELLAISGTWLGFNLVLEPDGVRGLGILIFGIRMIETTVTGLPLFLVLLARWRPRPVVVAAFVFWCPLLFAGATMIPIYDGDSFSYRLRQIPPAELWCGALLVVTAVNGFLLRCFGFRLRSELRPAQYLLR